MLEHAVMKKEIHPPYQEVLFIDSSSGYKLVCGSTLRPEERETFEGKEYPAFRVAISSASHPAFTGSKQFIDSEGRVDKFFKRYGGRKDGDGAQQEGDAGQQGQQEASKQPTKEAKKKDSK
jgi:large subunit ribosomal protein L31